MPIFIMKNAILMFIRSISKITVFSIIKDFIIS